jgi:hypothetical protein
MLAAFPGTLLACSVSCYLRQSLLPPKTKAQRGGRIRLAVPTIPLSFRLAKDRIYSGLSLITVDSKWQQSRWTVAFVSGT